MKKYNYFDDDRAVDDVRSRVRQADAKEQQRIENSFSYKMKSFTKNSGKKLARKAKDVLSRNPLELLENASRNKKRFVTVIMFLVFIIFLVSLIGLTVLSVNKENKRIQQFNADAGSVCSQYIVQYGNSNYENLYNKYKIRGYRMTGLCYAREMDFNRDNTSELLLIYNDSGVYYVDVWGYNDDKKFVALFHEKAAQTKKKKDDAWVTVYAKNNRYYIGVHDESDLSKVSLYGMRGGKFEKRFNCTYDSATEAFSIRKKVDPVSFERIKLAVLNEQKANMTLNLVSNLVDDFSSGSGDAALKAVAQTTSLTGSYYKVVEGLNQKYGAAKYVERNGYGFIDGLAVVDLVDFDGDGTEELVTVYRKTVKSREQSNTGNYVATEEDKYYFEVYRYNGSSALIAYKGEGISNNLNNEREQYYILKTENGRTLYCQNSFSTKNYGRTVNASSSMMRFDKTSFTTCYKASYTSDYGYTEYFLDDEEVRKSKFAEEGYAVPFFDGTDDYDTSKFSVTYLQRKVSKSGDIKSQVDKTVAKIKELNKSYNPQ
ncbi:MAG: hypothetical protein IKF64_01215 [Eubacterium sp.]|nr:hypothetical protein [Eubacterium sp.]